MTHEEFNMQVRKLRPLLRGVARWVAMAAWRPYMN